MSRERMRNKDNLPQRYQERTTYMLSTLVLQHSPVLLRHLITILLSFTQSFVIWLCEIFTHIHKSFVAFVFITQEAPESHMFIISFQENIAQHIPSVSYLCTNTELLCALRNHWVQHEQNPLNSHFPLDFLF